MVELMIIVMARDMAGPLELGRGFSGGGKDNVIQLAAENLVRAAAVRQTGGQTVGMGDTLPFGTWDPRLGTGAEYMTTMMDVVDGSI